jgi:hypothetical protein
MHGKIILRSAGAILIALLPHAFALAGEPPDTREKVPWEALKRDPESLVGLLGHTAFDVREKASTLLLAQGESALPALKAAAKSKDPEVALRADGLFRKIRARLHWKKRAVDALPRGLALLARIQRKDGSWVNGIGYKLNDRFVSTDRGGHVGVTALAGLAFLAAGHTPKAGKHTAATRKAVDFVLSCADPDSGWIKSRTTRLYSHAFAGLFLAEVQVAAPEDRIRKALGAAVDLLVNCQGKRGGWRYLPFAADDDLSVTACVLKFLRAAKRAGATVPDETISKAEAYVKKCRNRVKDLTRFGPGGAFHYQASEPNSRITFALTAAGMACMGAPVGREDPETEKGFAYLLSNRPVVPAPPRRAGLGVFYGHFHAACLFRHADEKRRLAWWDPTHREIVEAQGEDDCWIDDVGANYATAAACLILASPKKKLTIFR